MSRDEYRKLVADTFDTEGWKLYYSMHMNFPHLLKDVAVELFMRSDTGTKLALETQRRLLQLRDVGETDP